MNQRVTAIPANSSHRSAQSEGHDLAVEGAIDEIVVRIKGLEAKLVLNLHCQSDVGD